MDRTRVARLAILAIVGAVAGGAAAPLAHAQAPAGSVTKSSGIVTATLSWQAGEFAAGDPRLQVSRAGVVVTDIPVANACRSCQLFADRADSDYSIMHVADLDADGEPEVLFDVYSGGAHCCTTTRFYAYRPASGSYRRAPSLYWGNAGYDVVDLDGDGRLELSGQDDAFAYAFASFAGSAFPPRIVRYTAGVAGAQPTLRDVTRRFPAVIRADASRLLKYIREQKPRKKFYEAQGAIAAYVADEYLLKRGSVGKAELRRARRRGLTAPGFQRDLLAFLRRLGYR